MQKCVFLYPDALFAFWGEFEYELNQRIWHHKQDGGAKEKLTLKLWTFSYLGAKSLSLRVARRTSDVSCERAKDLIGCQKVEAGEVGLAGAGARLRGSEALPPETGREGIEPALTFKLRAALNKEPFRPISFSARLRDCFLALLTTYDSRLGIVGFVVLVWI